MTVKQSINESLTSLVWWREMITIVIGCAMCAVGFVFFINPYNIVPGGVYGMGIVLHNIFPTIQVGTFGYMMDIPLLIIAILIFGKQFGGRTLFANQTIRKQQKRRFLPRRHGAIRIHPEGRPCRRRCRRAEPPRAS